MPADSATFYSCITKEVGHFKLGDLQLQHISFTYHNIAKKDKIIKFPDISPHFKEIEINSLT